jgi:hypothetical protein
MSRLHNKPERLEKRAAFPRWIFVFAGLVGLLSGCGESTPPTLAPVVGKVFYHGRPVARGLIVFVPDAQQGAAGPMSRATIGPDGSYTLHTGDGVGAVPGAHCVTIAAVEGQSGGEPRSLLPEKYRDPDRSGLRCEIAADRPNTVNFHLE